MKRLFIHLPQWESHYRTSDGAWHRFSSVCADRTAHEALFHRLQVADLERQGLAILEAEHRFVQRPTPSKP